MAEIVVDGVTYEQTDYTGVTNGTSWNQNNDIQGTDGNDYIIAGPGTAPAPIQETNPKGQPTGQPHDVSDNDTITESSGTNLLTGGYGNDTFKFVINFQETSTIQTATYDDIKETPTQISGSNTNGVWNSYLSNLAQWRADMAEQHGADSDTSAQTQAYTYSSGKVVKSGVATYDDSYSWYEHTTSTNTSTNTITDFGNGHDSIVLAGITAEQFTANAHFSDDGTSVTIGTFTITTLGHALSISDFNFV